VHAVSQQTPSTQWPEPQSPLALHGTPPGSEQVPTCPATSHFSAPGQAETSQQTPSVQKPETQLSLVVHAVPLESFAQCIVASHVPVAQPATLVHDVGHAVELPSHR
jgi:hypothetical protein